MEGTGIPKKERKAVLQRDSIDDWCCCIVCGRPADGWGGVGMHLHHVVRRSQGGQGVRENLVCLCAGCHTKIHAGDQEIQKYCEDYLKSLYGKKAMPKS